MALLFLALSGCALVGPNYQPPEIPAPKGWQASLEGGLAAEAPDAELLARWWEVFGDPLLTRLEERAVGGNLDVKAAVARVREARALRRGSRAGRAPRVDLSASAVKSRSSADSSFGMETEIYDVGFDAGWEVDLFGAVRRRIEAAEAELAASREGVRAVLVSLAGEVAREYLEIRTLQARLRVLRRNVDLLRQVYDYTLDRYRAGLVDELAVARSRGDLEQTRARIPQLEIALAAAKNRLAVLMGEPPGGLETELREARPLPAIPATVAVGVPADMLRRRPDIRRAERQLAAQTARIGMATADLYPRLRLAGSIGLEALRPEDLPQWLSRTFRIGPSVSWNVFDGGAIRANIEAQDARAEQALFAYRKTVLAALEEVETVLTAFVKDQEQLHSLTIAKQAVDEAARLADDRYRAGIVDVFAVLDAQRAVVAVEDQLAQARGAVAKDLARLFKALGGGWRLMETGGSFSAPNPD